MDPITLIVAIGTLFTGLVVGNHGPTVQLEAVQNELRQTQAVVRDLEQKLAEKDQEIAVLMVENSDLKAKLAVSEAGRRDLSQTLEAAHHALGIQNTDKNTLAQGAQNLELWYRSALTDIDRLKAELDKRNTLVERGMISAHKLLAAQAAIRGLEVEIRRHESNEKRLEGLLAKNLLLQTANETRVAKLESALQATDSKFADAEKQVQSLSKRNNSLFAFVLFLVVLVVIFVLYLVVSTRRTSIQPQKTTK